MKLFISWSGDLSRHIALQLKERLPIILPFLEPWVSSEDIPKGSRWGSELASQLEGTDSGVLCLVPGNISQPWLVFEAGALSKSVEKGRVHPIYFGVDPADVTGPLSQFQGTLFFKDDMKLFLRALNSEAGSAGLPVEGVDRAFATCWSDLESRVATLLASSAETQASSKQPAAESHPPTEEEQKLLAAIANDGEGHLLKEEAAAALDVHPQRAQHIMERLEGQGLLVAAHNYVHGTSWSLSKTGRELLVRLGLL